MSRSRLATLGLLALSVFVCRKLLVMPQSDPSQTVRIRAQDLNDPDPAVRQKTAEGFAKLGKDDDAAKNEQEVSLPWAAATALGRIGLEAKIPDLIQSIASKDVQLRYAPVKA